MQFNCSQVLNGVCNATTLTSVSLDGHTTDMFHYDNRRIVNCTPNQTQILITTIDQMRTSMPSILDEVIKGGNSDAFKLYFKLENHQGLIESVYQKIASGAPVNAEDESGNKTTTDPQYICARPGDFTGAYYDRCLQVNSGATTFIGQPYMILCPAFFLAGYPSPLKPNPPECPNLSGSTSLPDDSNFTQNKLSTLIHESAHLYLGRQREPELYGLRDCAGLDAANAFINANNWAWFAMSQFSFLSLLLP